MAVPKKKKSHLKNRNRYIINHIKNPLNRSISFNEFDLINILKNRKNELDSSWGNHIILLKRNKIK